MPAVDLAARVHRLAKIPSSALADLLTDGTAEWGPHEENTARLLEAQDYALQLVWVDRTTDPEDRELKRERAAALREGIKPPKRPMIPPTAYRPKPLAAQRLQEYLDLVEAYQLPDGPQFLSLDEFDAALDIDTEFSE
jgi:hypothetical protein